MAEPQPPEWEALRTYVGASSDDETFVASCWAQAKAMVGSYVGEAEVPAELLERAHLECGSEFYHRRQAPNGIAQFASLDGAPVRVARDPMLGVYPILGPFIGLGIA